MPALLALLFLASCVRAQPAPPRAVPDDGVRATATVRYYDLTGRSAQDLVAGMQRIGPEWEGRRFFGLTTTSLEYAYRHHTDARGCRPAGVRVTQAITITLPRWAPPPGTPYALERDWRHFERALRGHEDEHRRLGEQEAAELHRAIAALRAPTCDALDTEVRRWSAAVRARFVAAHESYDRRTEHGRTQGAVFPRR